ncbi:MAG: Heavy metal RND efflux outer membrane protein, CzcC family [uncultured Sulfurovum sp.]|uniref:Heavy metal RND efflux outer membrane protein, CzcC family n=1 Tax=uncultured Sulfurovum sp. TaxID=269237 RepID=A0A6S6SFP8_9BACT|nr:MAG: Heavy metal RND efflux outer membrane protein, CzcC family [uncultured Sulfurovum sp.]
MKSVILGLFVVVNLHAVGYEELLQRAIQNNTTLKINKTKEQSIALQGQIEMRLANPNFEFEVADFSAKRVLRENQFGTRVGVSQSLLLPSLKRDKKALTQSRVALSTQEVALEKSEFIYGFNLYYLAYKEAVKKEILAQEALVISQKTVAISKARFKAGSVAKSEFLQAKIEEQGIRTLLKKLQLTGIQSRDSLLRFSNVSEAIEVETAQYFVLSQVQNEHPLLKVTKQKEKVAKEALKVASHKIESFELFSEIEAEPEQDIFRIGVSIALPIFNQKSEEKQLAKIELNNQKLALAFEKKSLRVELFQRLEAIRTQQQLESQYEVLIVEQKQLLALYQEGYRVAKVNLLKLNILKEQLLQSKEKLLETKISIEENSIKINYLQGAYNE